MRGGETKMGSGIWKSFLELFQQQESNSSQKSLYTDSEQSAASPDPPLPLEDSDYELLFRQLLEGIRLGWDRDRVLKYLEDLGSDRGDQQNGPIGCIAFANPCSLPPSPICRWPRTWRDWPG